MATKHMKKSHQIAGHGSTCFNSSTQEAAGGSSLRVQGQPNLRIDF